MVSGGQPDSSLEVPTCLRVLMAIIVAGTSLIGPGARAGQEPSPLAVDDPEAYRVYAFLLSTEWPRHAAKPNVFAIQRETSTFDCMFARGKRKEPSFVISNGVVRPFNPNEQRPVRLPDPTWTPVLDAYLANQTVRTLLPGQELGVPYRLVTAREISGGYIQMSAVGFDAAGTRARVYMGYQCGGLCGGGNLHLLEKVNGGWREAAKLCLSRA